MSLFENITDSKIEHPVILLIDSSGSVRTDFGDSNNYPIFLKMREICKNINADMFRAIFWNSNLPGSKNATQFPIGVIKFPHVITKETLNQPFMSVETKISNTSLTFPHLGFDAIPSEWIDNTLPTHIYFVTDGQIGYQRCPAYEIRTLKNSLSNSIKKLFEKNNNVHLHLIAVEDEKYDFNNVESVDTLAGGDVFNVIKENKLTNFLTEFTSYIPKYPDGYTHIKSVIPPAGFVPYEGKIFSEKNTGEFVQFIKHDIINADSEEKLVRIVQNLTGTINVLTKDKPKMIKDSIINMFCSLFENTLLDPSFVQFLLTDSLQQQNSGQALAYSEYRSKLKTLYKQAQQLLTSDTKNALGYSNEFFTLPVSNIVISGPSQVVNRSISLCGGTYPRAAVGVDHLVLPVLPNKNNSTHLNEQCTRQFVRSIVASQYGVNQMGDIVMYVVLGLVLKVVLSDDISFDIKNAYRRLGHTMLKKKRLNTDITELSRLEDGHLPIPNSGLMQEFNDSIDKVKNILGVSCSTMTLWYALCLALENEHMITKQLIHCSESIQSDFPEVIPIELLHKLKEQIVPIVHMRLPSSIVIDYKCIVTLDDCTTTGGYRIKKHGTTGCEPIFLYSTEGYQQAIREPVIYCPVCYTNLTADSFEAIGPKEDSKVIFDELVQNPYAYVKSSASTRYSTSTASSASSTSHVSTASNASNVPISSNKTGIVILMRGTVGAGKTTYSNKIKEIIESMGGVCIVEGTDKYCVQGQSFSEARENVKNSFININNITNDTIVVIIDTCGYTSVSKTIFGYDFSKWNHFTFSPNLYNNRLDGYKAWTLRNVLNRTLHDANSSYWLNPEGADVTTCVNVHTSKCKKLFGKKTKPVTYSANKEIILREINDLADDYQTYLDSNKEMCAEINKFLTKTGLANYVVA
jgi:hypothetical protein